MGDGNSSHDLITKAYNNDFGVSFVNTIDWDFNRDPQTEHVTLTKLTGDDDTDISFIFYDSNFVDVFNGVSSCGSSRNTLFNVNNTLGKMIGYINDPNINENN